VHGDMARRRRGHRCRLRTRGGRFDCRRFRPARAVARQTLARAGVRRADGGREVRGFWTIFKRELLSLFVTPVAWIVIVFFLIIQGAHFYLMVYHFAQNAELTVDQGPVQAFFGESILFYLPLILLCPGMTMRLFAEER